MSNIRWYADNSYIHGIWGAEIEDILIFGGIAMERDAEQAISAVMENMKKPYKQEADFPVKWNIRDLKEYYEKKGLAELYKVLLAESKEWRSQVFEAAAEIEFTIIIAIIKAYSQKRETIIETKERLTRYVFSDALMRVGHHAKEINADAVELFLDWPEANQPRNIFDEEYQSALIYGVTCEKQEYHCGVLKELGFSDSVLIVGTTKELVNLALEKVKDTFGFECIRKLNMKFRGAPGDVVGRGLIIAPTSGEFIDKVKQFMPKLYE